MLYLSFRILNEKYAIPVTDVNESVQYSRVTSVPRMPDYVLGLMNLRGKIIPVYDTRVRMGLSSIYDERSDFIEMMKKREQEHHEWINTLENEVKAGKKCTVQRDPTLCAFGKWYYPYMEKSKSEYEKNGSGNNVTYGILKKFKEPHESIHRLADEVQKLVESGEKERAIALINRTRETNLSELSKLFQIFYTSIEELVNRDIVIIVNKEDSVFGMTVDAIDSTVEIKELEDETISSEIVDGIGIVGTDTIQIFNLDAFKHHQLSNKLNQEELTPA